VPGGNTFGVFPGACCILNIRAHAPPGRPRCEPPGGFGKTAVKKTIPIMISLFLSACGPSLGNATAENVPPAVQGITLPPKWTETRTMAFPSETPGKTSASVPGAETVDASAQGPTPTIVPEEQCPNFPLDPLPADFSRLTDPSVLIGKRFGPGEGGEFLILATELDSLSHFLVVSEIETGNLAWIERFLCWDPDGMPYFEVKGAVLMKPFSSDQSISLDCWSGGDPIVFALAVGSVNVDVEPVEFIDRYGWLFDRLDYGYFLDVVHEKIVPAFTAGWMCMKPYGL
jgi:hypothetical protein